MVVKFIPAVLCNVQCVANIVTYQPSIFLRFYIDSRCVIEFEGLRGRSIVCIQYYFKSLRTIV